MPESCDRVLWARMTCRNIRTRIGLCLRLERLGSPLAMPRASWMLLTILPCDHPLFRAARRSLHRCSPSVSAVSDAGALQGDWKHHCAITVAVLAIEKSHGWCRVVPVRQEIYRRCSTKRPCPLELPGQVPDFCDSTSAVLNDRHSSTVRFAIYVCQNHRNSVRDSWPATFRIHRVSTVIASSQLSRPVTLTPRWSPRRGVRHRTF